MTKASLSAGALEEALAEARGKSRRARARQRVLLAAAAIGVVAITAANFGMTWAAGSLQDVASSSGFRLFLVLTLASATVVAVLAALRAADTRAACDHDANALEFARDAFEHARTPRVELHPYRQSDDADPLPRIVVRSNAIAHPLPRVTRPAATTVTFPLTRSFVTALVLGAVVVVTSALFTEARSTEHRWTFVDDASDPRLLGFRSSNEAAGSWALKRHAEATGARALVNATGNDGAAPAVLLAAAVHGRDLSASTRCKVTPPAGSVASSSNSPRASSEACGIAFRAVDERNHHVARLDLARGRIVVAVIAGGQERIVGAANARLELGVWQVLAVQARGDRIYVSCNGQEALTVRDREPASFGAVGLWAPAAAEAYFDELFVEILPPRAQGLNVIPLLGTRPPT